MRWQTKYSTKISAAFIANSCPVLFFLPVQCQVCIREYINASKVEKIIYTDINKEKQWGLNIIAV